MDDCQANDQPSAIIFSIPMPIFLDSFSYSRIQKLQNFTSFFLLGCVSVFGWLRLAEVVKVYYYLIQLGLNPHPLYFAISGGLIGLLFSIAWIARLTKRSWSTKFIRLCIIFLGGLFLIENFVLSLNQSSIFSMAIELIFILVIYLLTDKSSKSLKNNEN
jgi:hypothetical protein